jgi:hypothetical protein
VLLFNLKTLFIYNWQLLGKLIFSPSHWCRDIAQFDLKLAPDFAFTDLPTHFGPVQGLQRLRYIIFFIQPLWIGIAITLILLLARQSLENLSLGVSYGITVALVAGAVGSFTVSLVYGLIGSVIGGLSTGLIVGFAGKTGNVAAIWFGIFAITMAGSITASLTHTQSPRALGWQLFSILIGLISLAIILFFGDLLASLVAQQVTLFQFDEAEIRVIGMVTSLGLILGWRLKGWRWGLTFGLFAGSMMGLSINVGSYIIGEVEPQWLENIIRGILGGAVNAALFVVLFALPYLLALYIADVWAGVIAGILGCAGVYLGFIYYLSPDTSLSPLIGSLIAFILGITQIYWRPIVFYPITAFWNLSLHLAQRRQPDRSCEFFYKHSVFWDEHQFLPLFGLEKQLITLYHSNPDTGREMMRKLAGTAQNWAVVASHRELDLQALARCETIFAIAEVHQSLLTNSDAQEAHEQWLRHFRQGSVDVERALSLPSNAQQQAELKAVVASLNVLGGMIAKTHTSDIDLRIKEIANHWQTVVEKYIQELDQIQKIPNPYTFGPPLNKRVHDVFAERPEVIRRLQQLLQAHNCPPLLLYGQRRTGKTTLLINMDILLPDNFIMLFVDCQSPIAWAENHASFFYNLSKAMTEAAEKAYPAFTYPALDRAAFQMDAFAEFTNWLIQLEQAVGDKIILLAFDEFVILDAAFSEGRLQLGSVLGMFRHIIQHRPRFRLLFAGTHTFKELQHWASYFIGVQIIHLSYLLENEARRLIEQPIKYFPLRYTPQAVARILALTHSHPALLQLLCSELVQIKDSQLPHQRFQVELADVEAAIPSTLQFGEFFFTDIKQNQIDKLGLRCLNFIAAQGEGAIVSSSQLFPLVASEEELQNSIEQLLQRELIEEIKEPAGYRFQVELIRRWFSNNQRA